MMEMNEVMTDDEEYADLAMRWSYLTGLFKGCSKPKDLTLLLENQRLFNLNLNDPNDRTKFHRKSILFLRGLFVNMQDIAYSTMNETNPQEMLTDITWNVSDLDKFSARRTRVDLERESELIDNAVKGVEKALRYHMQFENISQICILGVNQKPNGKLAIFYDSP